MDRRLLFPIVAASAWAQQPVPAPAPSKAEIALRARVEKFFQLQNEKQYSQALTFVSQDSRDDYLASGKPQLVSFSISGVEWLEPKKRARVTVKAKESVLMLGGGPIPFIFNRPTYWKLERGKWMWYLDPEQRFSSPAGRITPGPGSLIGKLDEKGKAPPVEALVRQVEIDKLAVALTKEEPDQSVEITNGLPGSIQLELDSHVQLIKGISVRIVRPNLNPAEKTLVLFHLTGEEKVADTVVVQARPLNKTFEIRVTAN